jgi:hypothetical protein
MTAWCLLGNMRGICWLRLRSLPGFPQTPRGEHVTIAYLDAGSGSLIASALVGGAAAAGVAVRQARHRFTSKFSRKRSDPVDGVTPAVEAPAPPAAAAPDATAATDTATDPATSDA